jgi:hypothetical protein
MTSSERHTQGEEHTPIQVSEALLASQNPVSLRSKQPVMELPSVPWFEQSPGMKTSSIGELWEEAVAQYRQTLRSTKERLMFEEPLAMNRRYTNEWQSFQKSGKQGRIKKKLQDVASGVAEKIQLMDVVIGYPTQAVIRSRFI